MRGRGSSRGFTLVEVLVSLGVLSVALAILAALMVENSKVNREQQLRLELQSNARAALSLISQVLRTAGWDPTEANFGVVTLDADPTDGVETLEAPSRPSPCISPTTRTVTARRSRCSCPMPRPTRRA
jgi:prepilin-type N-terminal cleavage/methylation domain-containing protein